MEFNLSDLFKSYEEFKVNLEQFKKRIDSVEIKEVDLSNLHSTLNLINELKEVSTKLLVYSSLRYYKDINNELCIEDKKEATNINETVLEIINKINAKIVNIENLEKITGEYSYYLSKIIKQNNNSRVSVKENNLAINELLDEYNSLLASINYGEIIVDNKEIQLTPTNYGKYVSARNIETRNAAYKSVHVAFLEKEQEFIKIMQKLSDLKKDSAIKKGYSSVLEQTLNDDLLEKSVIEKLTDSVNNNLDIIHNYLSNKTKYLGINNPTVIDCGLSIVNKNYKYTLEEAKEIILNALKPLGEEYLQIVKKLFNGHIDTIIDLKKHQTITFSWMDYSFLSYKENYIDLKNLIHEIGHIVNYYLSKQKQIFLYEDSSVFCGEIASLVNEILLNKYLTETSINEEDKLFYLTKNIENYFIWIYKKTMETEFEQLIHNRDDISSSYEKLIKKYYGDLNYTNFSNIEWSRLGILFRRNFYSFKYATGLLIASEVTNKLLKDQTYIKNYISFLESGDSDTPRNLLAKLNIDLDDLSEGFQLIKKDVKKFENIINKNNK